MLSVKRVGLIVSLAVLVLAPAGAAQSAAAPASAQDKQFLQEIHQVNLTEIRAGNLAQQQGTNQELRNLGVRFVTDHAQLDQKAQSVSGAVGVTLPQEPNPEQLRVLRHLESVNGTEFDTQWLTAQLTGHSQAMQIVQAELDHGSDPAVKQLAQQTAPVIQAHHNALVALAQTLGVPIPGGSLVAPSPSGSSATPGPSGTSATPGPSGTSATPGPSGTSATPGPSGTSATPGPSGGAGTPSPSDTEIGPSPENS